MTPYVANDKDNSGKKPRSIMVHPAATVNGDESPDECVRVSTTGEPINGDAGLIQDESSGDGDSIKPLLNGRGKGLTNGNRTTKAGALKRVSFGSSKGSMVETLVYDHNDDLLIPHLQQHCVPLIPHGVGPVYQGHHFHHHISHHQTSAPTTTQPLTDRLKDDPQLTNSPPHLNGHADASELEKLFADWQLLGPEEISECCEEVGGVLVPSRVKVSFFESQKPNYVTTPESPDIPLDFLNITVMSTSPGGEYQRQQSTDSGLDNPFRPDGELSREADTIVSLIKEGKPITPVKSEPDGGGYFPTEEVDGGKAAVNEDAISPTKAKNVENIANNKVGANGNAPHINDKKIPAQPGVVEVQHGVVVPPSDASQVEQVVIKKKPKCKCCVIQ